MARFSSTTKKLYLNIYNSKACFGRGCEKKSVVNVLSPRVSKGHFPMCLQRTKGDNNIRYGDSLTK